MKNICGLLIILFQTIFLFGQERDLLLFEIESIECTVMEIDSIENFYLIYVKSNEEEYKIVSKKMNNNCSKIHLRETYKLSINPMFPPILNFLDQKYHIGEGVFIDIDWGNNLYYAKEFCGLCYETDSIKIRKCSKLIEQQNKLENALLNIYFHYDNKKNKHVSFADFYKESKKNSSHFITNKTISIPVYEFPEIGNIIYRLFSESSNEEIFHGQVFFKYKNFYFITGYYDNDREVEILGWVEKKYLSHNLNIDIKKKRGNE